MISLTREIVLLEMFNSPHFIAFCELITTNKDLYMFMEYANGGSLKNLIEIKGYLPELAARKVI